MKSIFMLLFAAISATSAFAAQDYEKFIATVVAAKPASIPVTQKESGHKAVGTAAGALVGGLLGHALGGKHHKTLGFLAGAGAGALVGNKMSSGAQEKTVGQVPGVELRLKKADGALVDLTQPAEQNVSFAPGDSVTVWNEPEGWHAVKAATAKSETKPARAGS